MLKMQLDNDVSSFEVTKQAHDEYNAWIRRQMEGRVWTSPACNSWFKTKDGFIPTNFPGTTMYAQLSLLRFPHFFLHAP